jgi:hypothetical protein
MKFMFLPISALGSFLAGFIAKKLFSSAWRAVDDQGPPSHKHRVDSHGKLALSLALEGATAGVMKGGFDHASRHGYARLTGSWPGEEQPEDE